MSLGWHILTTREQLFRTLALLFLEEETPVPNKQHKHHDAALDVGVLCFAWLRGLCLKKKVGLPDSVVYAPSGHAAVVAYMYPAVWRPDSPPRQNAIFLVYLDYRPAFCNRLRMVLRAFSLRCLGRGGNFWIARAIISRLCGFLRQGTGNSMKKKLKCSPAG